MPITRLLAITTMKLATVWLLVACQSIPSNFGAKQACTDLILDYAYYRDRTDLAVAAPGVAELFTTDAILNVGGNTFIGKQAIHDRIANQTQAPLTQHLMSNIRITVDGPQKARGISYATIYAVPQPLKDKIPSAKGFAAIGEYHDQFVRTRNGWRIAERKFFPRIHYSPK